MAEVDYQIVNANELDTSLTAISSVIKKKSQISDTLEFPLGFMNAVNSIKAEKPEQRKTVEITKNGTTEILPDEGNVLSGVDVAVNVSSSGGSENWYDFTIEVNQSCTTGKELLDALTPSLSDMVSGYDVAICTLQNVNKNTLTPNSSAGQALQCYIYRNGNTFAGTVSKYRNTAGLVNPALMTSSSAITPYYPCTYYVKIIHLFDKGA